MEEEPFRREHSFISPFRVSACIVATIHSVDFVFVVLVTKSEHNATTEYSQTANIPVTVFTGLGKKNVRKLKKKGAAVERSIVLLQASKLKFG